MRPSRAAALCGLALGLLASTPASAWPGLDGRISFGSDRAPEHASGDLFTVAPDGGDVRRLTDAPGDDAQSAWSPDGRRIAFRAARDGSNQLAWTAWDGSGREQLTRTSRWSEGQPAWTPDGRRLLFRRTPEHPLVQDGELWMLDPAATVRLEEPAVAPVLERPGDERDPGVSPDGTRIAFRGDLDLRADTGDEELHVAPWDGVRAGPPVRVTRDLVRDSAPAWSPDGTRIVFTSERDGNAEISVMRADGRSERRLTRDPATDESPDWQAVPHAVAGARACGDVRLGPGGAASVVVRGALCAQARATARAFTTRAAAGRPPRRAGRFGCARPAAHTFDLRPVRCAHVARPARTVAFAWRAPARLAP